MELEKTLLSVEEFCTSCKYVVRVGRRVLIHKELLDAELKKSAKLQLKM